MNTARNIATAIAAQLQQAGYMAVFAGGSVRDSFLGLEPKDFDIATNATPEQIKSVFQGDTVLCVGEAFGVVVVVRDGENIEIATFRGDGQYGDGRRPDDVKLLTGVDPLEALKEDAARRDLTVNAMFLDPVSGVLYDFFGGRNDIDSRTLRAVGDAEARFAEDRLRMLRVARFAAKLDFTVEPALMEALKKNADKLMPGLIVSWERIARELEGILLSRSPVVGLELLRESGLLHQFLPEMSEMVGPSAMQDPIWHPEGSAWTHTMMVMAEAAKEVAMEEGDNARSFEFMLGVFLHDIAKPRTMTTRVEVMDGVDGTAGKKEVVRISNFGHAEVGAVMAKDICRRLKLSADTTNRVSEIVRLHMQMHDMADPSIRRSKLVKLMERSDILDLIRMQHCDVMGTGRSLAERQASSHRAYYLALREKLAACQSPSQRLGAEALVTGKQIKELGFKPGPVFRVIKEAAFEAQHDGVFTDAAGASQWLKENAERLASLPEPVAAVQTAGSKHCC